MGTFASAAGRGGHRAGFAGPGADSGEQVALQRAQTKLEVDTRKLPEAVRRGRLEVAR